MRWLVLLALLTGCATAPQTRALLADGRGGLPATAELAQTPFFPQEDHQCGPAALATALAAAGMAAEPEAIVRQVYLPGRQGSLQVEMLASVRRQGAVPYVLAPQLHALLAEVAAGTPVVVLQNLGLDALPVWHYAVVVGYDLGEGHLLLRSGREARQALGLTTFERTWARGGHWAFVALPPGRLPATGEADAYLAEVMRLEALGLSQAARAAYAAAQARWPDSLAAAVGLGNAAYAQDELAAAELAFLLAVRAHPDSVAALNNLAHVLARRGRLAEALAAARQAVALGGPYADEAQATLREIEAALP